MMNTTTTHAARRARCTLPARWTARTLGVAVAVAAVLQPGQGEAQPLTPAAPAAPAQPAAALAVARLDSLTTVPAGWLPQDPADSLYRAARARLREGRYAEAARAFASIRADFPASGYAGDSYYFEAFARSRMDRIDELRRALALLAEQREAHARAASLLDARTLALRIETELARRGVAGAAEAITRVAETLTRTNRARADGAPVGCDSQDLALRMTALNALLRVDPARARSLLRELARDPDACSAEVRGQAVFLLIQQDEDDPETLALLIELAREDPAPAVRRAAAVWLVRSERPAAREAVLGLLRSRPVDPEVVRDLLRILPDPGAPEIAGLLRDLYAEVDDAELRVTILAAVARDPGPETADWLVARALDPSEVAQVRSIALFRAGELGLGPRRLLEIYRGAADSRLRAQAIVALTRSPDVSEKIDVLLEIARTEEDPVLRTQVIVGLAESDDPRAREFLVEVARGGGGR